MDASASISKELRAVKEAFLEKETADTEDRIQFAIIIIVIFIIHFQHHHRHKFILMFITVYMLLTSFWLQHSAGTSEGPCVINALFRSRYAAKQRLQLEEARKKADADELALYRSVHAFLLHHIGHILMGIKGGVVAAACARAIHQCPHCTEIA